MTSLFSKSFCASILTAIIVVRSQTADIFDLTKAAFGLDERHFLDSSSTGHIAGLINMIPKKQSDMIDYFEKNSPKTYRFLSELLFKAIDVADKKMDRKEASALVSVYYNELSASEQSELDRLSKDINQLSRGIASIGDSSYSTEKSELQNMLNLLSCLQGCRKEFTETVFRIRGLLKGEPVSFAAQDFKQIFDSFKKGVEDVAKLKKGNAGVAHSKNYCKHEDIEALVYAYGSFCSAVAAGDPSKKNTCNMTVTYAESLVAAGGTNKEKLKKLAEEMHNVEKLLKI